jgi:hypothetical protein
MCPSSHTRRPPPSYIFSQMEGRTRHDSDFGQHRDRGLFNHAHSAHAGVGIHTSVGARTTCDSARRPHRAITTGLDWQSRAPRIFPIATPRDTGRDRRASACFEFGIAICASANQTDYGPSLYRFEFHQFVPLGKGAGSHRRAPLFGHGALRYGQQNRSPQLSLRRAGLFLFQIEGSAGCTGLGGT